MEEFITGIWEFLCYLINCIFITYLTITYLMVKVNKKLVHIKQTFSKYPENKKKNLSIYILRKSRFIPL